uniref:Uncharacterized protein n=1 Tax=Hemiselmis andersenii TaxID=464988 RepID=A0A6T8PCF3_HEMAN|mmetsp:Transcript_27409/g.66773  ORF Transcript_27409/g.66773 Transcript_27409/m.66773 type:complete len:143 (+) Transcript_27409:108-536(+)
MSDDGGGSDMDQGMGEDTFEDEEEVPGEGTGGEMESEVIVEEEAAGGMTLEGRKKQKRTTTPYMTKYERARIIGTRALQISMNAPVMVDVGKDTDPMKIAMLELAARKIPFIIRRTLPNGTSEDWAVNELVVEHHALTDRYK